MPSPIAATRRQALESLAGVVRLLSRAADQAENAATDAAGMDRFGLTALSVGAQLVASRTLGLLPPDAQVNEPVPAQGDPLELLRAAEVLTRTPPIEAYPPGTSHVIVAICDLIREHSS